MEEITIAMLGSSGVGKTTILASMYEQLTISRVANLQLIPDEESAKILEQRLSELKSMLARGQDGSYTVQIGKGITGTENPSGDPYSLRSFSFDIALLDKKPLMRLHFYDYPGGYISERARDIEKQFVTELLTEADVVIIAIDTPALVMRNGYYNEVVNKPTQITEMFKEAYKNLKEPKLILFVPVKCEMEMQRGEREANQLTERIKREYPNLLAFFDSPVLASKLAVVVNPIQTLGCVICTRILEPTNENNPVFGFRKHPSADAEYSPQDTEQPLCYILAFLLSLHLHNQNFLKKGIANLFRLNNPIKEAIRIFAKRCKRTRGFVILQGQQLLDINTRN